MKPDILNQNYDFSDASGALSESQGTEHEGKGKEEGCFTSIKSNSHTNEADLQYAASNFYAQTQQKGGYNTQSETNYSTAKKQLATFEELK